LEREPGKIDHVQKRETIWHHLHRIGVQVDKTQDPSKNSSNKQRNTVPTKTINKAVICPNCKAEIEVRSSFAHFTLTKHLKTCK
jgi:hypothetical protein